ncbi:hypothetical protein HFP89_07875 [Wenzhouxiangella sp. XN79A]|uniref:hypothetical protein n=1 Tax=Wenzhouxiangella sp. XN79A TaxID=2724193 RepID=UPI00144ACB06|nr:hypothetical protein [Wenzhouxiangella sp. XN79A]NKI35082.1 hypothetical protein [Wenzhouxiangella sp. XN79A]
MNHSESNERVARCLQPVRCLSALVLAVLAGTAFAQSQSIILDTSPTPTTIELLDGTDVLLDPLSGNITATPLDPAACSATTDCSDVQVSITSFNVSPSTVTQGQTTNFGWNGRGAWECQGAGLPATTWNGTKLPAGNQAVSTAALSPDTYTVTLECSNGPVTDTADVSLTVIPGGGGGGGVPAFCVDDGRVPPAGLTQDTAIIDGSSTVTQTWLQLFGQDFPQGNGRDTAIQRDRYASLQFDTDGLATGVSGRVTFDVLQTFVPSGQKIVTLSQCPGDFTDLNDNNCKRFLGQGSVRWAINSGGGFDCVLQPNTTYYLNILYTDNDDAPYDDWACTGASNPTTATQCGDIINSLVN